MITKPCRVALYVLVGWMLLSLTAHAQPGSPDGLTYKTSWSVIRAIGTDLQKSLKDKYRDMIHSQPVFLETDIMPSIKLVEYPDDSKPMRAVFISAGFIDLMNQVAHAKAIDRIEKGYFQKFIVNLSKESGDTELQELPNLSDKRFWTDDILNEQKGNFNQMVGMVVAIELSHHYLGCYKKYLGKIEEASGKQLPINNVITLSEWDAAMKAGVRNALDAGMGVEGLKALYDAIDKMPQKAQRPQWTAYFLPKDVKVDKVKKDLEKYEKKFFNGEEF